MGLLFELVGDMVCCGLGSSMVMLIERFQTADNASLRCDRRVVLEAREAKFVTDDDVDALWNHSFVSMTSRWILPLY